MLACIIIPICNVEEYIAKCLESVYQQTYSDIEIILVNDSTPDISIKITESIVNKYSTFINHKQNISLSDTQNNRNENY